MLEGSIPSRVYYYWVCRACRHIHKKQRVNAIIFLINTARQKHIDTLILITSIFSYHIFSFITMSRFITLVIAALLSAALLANALPLDRRGSPVNIKVDSTNEFCTYLPPKPGMPIGEAEGNAVPFCTKTQASGTRQLPSGFIKTAHFKQTSSYTQVTGRIDRSKYSLSASDGGGQYDNKVSILSTIHPIFQPLM